MPVIVESTALPLSVQQINGLWNSVVATQKVSDDDIVVRTVSVDEIRRLKKQYYGVDEATNVLTFSYNDTMPGVTSPSHDVALCLPIAEQEASEGKRDFVSYVALLLVHAFLHSTGLDHEQSATAAAHMHTLEKTILGQHGFVAQSL